MPDTALNRTRWVVLVSGISGLALIGIASFGRTAPYLIYNVTPSAPVGFYRVGPALPLQRGDLVLARTPDSVRALAAERGYVPATVSLVKRVAALDGDIVCSLNRAVTINGRHVADQLATDGSGRPLPVWTGCQRLRRNDIFLLMESVPASFDGRYFGPISVAAIIGKLVPLSGK